VAKKTIISTIIAIVTFLIASGTASALEVMSKGQLKRATAQSGVDISIAEAVTEIYLQNLDFINSDDPDNQYISFRDFHMFTEGSTGSSDVDNSGTINHLTFDVGMSYNDQAMIFLKSPDLEITTDLSIGSMNFCGTDLGSINMDNMNLSSFHLTMGPHIGDTGEGLDLETGLSCSIGTLTYNYNATDNLTLTGLKYDFQLGDLSLSNPATIDVSSAPTIVMNMPLYGSFKIDNISVNTGIGTTSLGSMDIKGVELQKLYIEIPGRGLGRP
jgi:hypothetical protein